MANERTKSKIMKKPISQLKNYTDYLSNLDEKDNLEYADELFQNNEVTKLFESIAEDLAKKALDFEYSPKVGSHSFLKCDEELSKELGFGVITICPYVGTIHNMWLKSNFMWLKRDEQDNLIIDIYYIDTNKDVDYIKGLVIQELFNFKRDAKWVVDGVYDEKMTEMKDKLDEETKELMKEIFNGEEK